LHQITTDELTAYQTERRKDEVANRTINAEVPELISRLWKRAKLWRVDRGELGEADFSWSALKLDIPKHRTRSASRIEEMRLMRKLRLDYRAIVRFAVMSGLRRRALILKRDQIDWQEMVIEYAKKSKHTGDKGWLPITPD